MLETRHNFLTKSGIATASSRQKIDLFIQFLWDLAEKANSSNISVVLIGSAQRNSKTDWRKEWFRIEDPATENLLKEVINASKLNKEILSRINTLRFRNLRFVDPIEVLDKSCGKSHSSYKKCFRDGDHMSDKSASQVVLHILNDILTSEVDSNKQN